MALPRRSLAAFAIAAILALQASRTLAGPCSSNADALLHDLEKATGADRTIPSNGGAADHTLPTGGGAGHPPQGASTSGGVAVAHPDGHVPIQVRSDLNPANRSAVIDADSYLAPGATTERRALQDTLADWQARRPGEDPFPSGGPDYRAQNARGNRFGDWVNWDPDLPLPADAHGQSPPHVQKVELHPERGDLSENAGGGSGSDVRRVILHGPDGSSKTYYFRPLEARGGASNLVPAKAFVAADLDGLLGTHAVPEGRWAKIGNETGFLSDAAPGRDMRGVDVHDVEGQMLRSANPGVPPAAVRKSYSDAKVIAFLFGDNDAHLANFHYDPATGKLWFFDQNNAFAAGFAQDGRSYLPFGRDLPTAYSQSTIDALRKLTNDVIDSRYGAYLSDEERRALEFRRDWILKDFEEKGRPVLSDPPAEGAHAAAGPAAPHAGGASPANTATAHAGEGSAARASKPARDVPRPSAEHADPGLATQQPGRYSPEFQNAANSTPEGKAWLDKQKARGGMAYRMSPSDFNEFARQDPRVGEIFQDGETGPKYRVDARVTHPGPPPEEFLKLVDLKTGAAREVPLKDFSARTGAFASAQPVALLPRSPEAELAFARGRDARLDSDLRDAANRYRSIRKDAAAGTTLMPGVEMGAEATLARAAQDRLRSYGVNTSIEFDPATGHLRLRVIPETSDPAHWVTKLAVNPKLGNPRIYFDIDDFYHGRARAGNGEIELPVVDLSKSPPNDLILDRTRHHDIDTHELVHSAIENGSNPNFTRISIYKDPPAAPVPATPPAPGGARPIGLAGRPTLIDYQPVHVMDEAPACGKNYKVTALRENQEMNGLERELARARTPAEVQAVKAKVEKLAHEAPFYRDNYMNNVRAFVEEDKQAVRQARLGKDNGSARIFPYTMPDGKTAYFYSFDGKPLSPAGTGNGVFFNSAAATDDARYADMMRQLEGNLHESERVLTDIDDTEVAQERKIAQLRAKVEARQRAVSAAR